jgi:hypothetical protein
VKVLAFSRLAPDASGLLAGETGRAIHFPPSDAGCAQTPPGLTAFLATGAAQAGRAATSGGGSTNSAMRSRIAANKFRVTVTSANWNVTCRRGQHHCLRESRWLSVPEAGEPVRSSLTGAIPLNRLGHDQCLVYSYVCGTPKKPPFDDARGWRTAAVSRSVRGQGSNAQGALRLRPKCQGSVPPPMQNRPS